MVKAFSSLPLVIAAALAISMHSVSASIPTGEHIGTPERFDAPPVQVGTPERFDAPPVQVGTPERFFAPPTHIGTPAHVAPAQQQYVGTAADAATEQVSDSMLAESKPRIAVPADKYPTLETRGRHHHKWLLQQQQGQHISGGKVTFYAGSQLDNPACPGFSTPNDWSMIAAISFDSPFQCGDKVKISSKDGKQAVVTVIDRCAGCSSNWFDVTKGVFQIFSGLDTGVLHDVTFSKV